METESQRQLIGILPKQDLAKEVEAGRLIQGAAMARLEACSYDMTIGTIFLDGQIINEEHSKANEPVVIKPGQIISMFTREELILPDDICATAFAINSQSSRGLLVLNPGHVDPGFQGPLTVKAVNLRQTKLTISRGAEIFTVIFERLPKKTDVPYNRNKSRREREREFNEKDVESAPRNLSDLVVLGEDTPFATRQEVKELVRTHWLSWISLSLAFVAALFSIVAAVAALIPLFPLVTAQKNAGPPVSTEISKHTGIQQTTRSLNPEQSNKSTTPKGK